MKGTHLPILTSLPIQLCHHDVDSGSPFISHFTYPDRLVAIAYLGTDRQLPIETTESFILPTYRLLWRRV